MRLVVSDTGPINYLVLIEHIYILPALFDKVFIPFSVQEELKDSAAPIEVRRWIHHPPAWLEVRDPPVLSCDDDSLSALGEGKREAIRLAASLQNNTVLLIDDREGVKAAIRRGLDKVGTLGVLDKAAQRGLLDLAGAFARMRLTIFRFPEKLMQKMLAECQRAGKL